MNWDRESREYRERKWAFQLVNSKEWLEFLKPLLEEKSEYPAYPNINSLDAAFQAAKYQGAIDAIKSLRFNIERLAEEFSNIS